MTSPRPWTPPEERRLVEWYDAGMRPSEIAARLGRTVGAVVQRACDLRTGRIQSSVPKPPRLAPRVMQLRSGLDPAVAALGHRLDEVSTRRQHMRLYDEAGYSPETVRRWRRGGSTPSVADLRAMLNVVGLDLAVVPLAK